MRIAIPHWQGRVSPVLDTAGRCFVIEVIDGVETLRHDVLLDGSTPRSRANAIRRLGAEVLICGALSRPLEMALQTEGIDVRPHVCGEIETVLQALIDGHLNEDAFLMPGCCGRRRRRGQGRRHRGGRCREFED